MANITATTFTFLGGAFKYGDGGNPTETFTPVTQVQSVDFSGSKRATEDVTSADNVDTYQRFAGRLKDPGTVTVNILWNPADPTHIALVALDDGNSHNFQCVMPGGLGTRFFAAIVETALDEKLELNKGTLRPIKLKQSGPVTFTAGDAD